MALPRVNEVLKFSLTIPSTGQTVRYRPYLVKEEKVLLQAFESKDISACLQSMCDTIESCIDDSEKIDVSSLATFDLEYMFLKVRSKSVGETSEVLVRCGECQEPNQQSIDLEEIKIDVSTEDFIVDITDDLKVEMKFPNSKNILKNALGDDDLDPMRVLADCISAVHTADERIDCSTENQDEVVEFLSSMTTAQFQKVSDFVENVPALTHDINFKCKKCDHDNHITLKGLSDFF